MIKPQHRPALHFASHQVTLVLGGQEFDKGLGERLKSESKGQHWIGALRNAHRMTRKEIFLD